WQPATGIDQVIRAGIIRSSGLSHGKPSARNHIIPIQKSFQVQRMVADVRGFDHGIFHDLTREGQVPLPTLRRAEVLTKGNESRRTGKRALQPRIDAIEAAEGRAVTQSSTASSPACVDRLSPGRVAA